jgi:hypothetical protein
MGASQCTGRPPRFNPTTMELISRVRPTTLVAIASERGHKM